MSQHCIETLMLSGHYAMGKEKGCIQIDVCRAESQNEQTPSGFSDWKLFCLWAKF